MEPRFRSVLRHGCGFPLHSPAATGPQPLLNGEVKHLTVLFADVLVVLSEKVSVRFAHGYTRDPGTCRGCDD